MLLAPKGVDAAHAQLLRAVADKLGHVPQHVLEELAKIAERDPFKRVERIEPQGDVMLCVVFFTDKPARSPKLPVKSTDNLELIAVHDGAAFVVARRKQNGWFGFPNGFVEKQLGVTATTRQWSTIKKFVAFAEKE